VNANRHAPAVVRDTITLRRIEAMEELQRCGAIQDLVWGGGQGFPDRVPASLLRVAQYVGGITAGAFDSDGTMLGFVFGFTGPRAGRLVHWSHMLAVLPEFRDRGLGTKLKLFQRELARESGAEHMLWTFDPLVARNAHLNVNHLGVRIDEYVPDMYGDGSRTPLHSGMGTDRFVVRWDLTAAAAEAREGWAPREWRDGGSSLPVLSLDAGSDGATAVFPAAAPAIRIEIPADVYQLMADAPEQVLRWRTYTRTAFLSYLGRGYQVHGFHRDPVSGRAWYLLVAG